MGLSLASGIYAADQNENALVALRQRQMRASLEPMVLIPATNQTHQNSLVAEFAPTASKPMHVHRLDTGVIAWTVDGTTWHRMSAPRGLYEFELNLWSTDSMYVIQSCTDTGWEMNLTGRLTRTGPGFSLSNTWTGIGTISLPTTFRPNVGPTDIVGQALYKGESPIQFLLNTTTGAVSIRSQLAPITWATGEFFGVAGVNPWYRDL